MLGDVSRDFGVQSYSESSKHWSSLDDMSAVMRRSETEMVASKALAEDRRITPPRWVDLHRLENKTSVIHLVSSYRRFVRDLSSSPQATWKHSTLVII